MKTYLAPSTIEGIGLFAGQDIQKGTITWKFAPGFDLSFSKEEVGDMPPLTQQFTKKYSVLSMVSGKYVLCNDDARFTNHSASPNLESVIVEGEIEKIARANREIEKGEELTIDYRSIDTMDAVSDEEYLASSSEIHEG